MCALLSFQGSRPNAIDGQSSWAARVNVSRCFDHTGVDYCGPFEILEARGRGKRRVLKGYVSLFICLSTKAIHLELATDLTTPTFLAALRRIMARRGMPSNIYSDNGTNFVVANNILVKERRKM